MTSRSKQLRLGLFVATTFVGLTGLVVMFGRSPRVFDARSNYTVTFSEAPGISTGTPVRKSGVRIGEVTAIDLDPASGLVKVNIAIEGKYAPRTSEDATIARNLFNGDTSLDFVPKTNAEGVPISMIAEVIPPLAEIPGVSPINTNALVKQASGVLPNAQESMAKILKTLERVEVMVPKIERAFDEIGSLAKTGREFIPELKKTNEKVQQLLAWDDPKDTREGIAATLRELREFSKASRPLLEGLNKILRENEADINGTIKAVRQASEGINDLLNTDNRKAISDSVKNVSKATTDLDKTLKQFALAVDAADSMLKNLNNRITQAGTLFDSADKAFKSAAVALDDAGRTFKNIEAATRPFSSQTEPLLKNFSSSSEQLNLTLVELRTLLASVNRHDGTLQRVISDPSLFHNVNGAVMTLTSTLMRAERVAADLQVFSDKIARRPELIGLGGAVRPSNGLKDSPAVGMGVMPPSPLEVPSLKPMEPIAPTRGGVLDLPHR